MHKTLTTHKKAAKTYNSALALAIKELENKSNAKIHDKDLSFLDAQKFYESFAEIEFALARLKELSDFMEEIESGTLVIREAACK